MMRRKKLWLVSEVFYPDVEIATGNIATEIALKFSESYDVHVICGPVGYESGGSNPLKKTPSESIFIHRINRFNFDKNNKIKRMVRVFGISFAMFLIGLRIKQRDKVFLISNPAFIIPFYAFLKSIKKFDFTLLMHDVFPENLIPGNYLKPTSWIYRLAEALFVKCRSTADSIVVLGRDMKALIQEKMPSNSSTRTTIIPNWADVDNIFPIIKEQIKVNPAKIVIQFAGNHGVLQNLSALLKIIRKVDNPEIEFVFAGSGAIKKELISYANEHKLVNVRFLPAFPRSELNNYLNHCDIGVVSLSSELFGVGVPSKSYNIAAAGKPILFLGNLDTEIALFVSENKVGWSFSYDDEVQIVEFFNNLKIGDRSRFKLIGARGREIVEANYNREAVLQLLFDSI